MLNWLRVLRTAGVTVTREVRVDGVLTDATDPLAVALTRLDGTSVATGTSTRVSTGTYTYAVPAQSQVDLLRLAWTGSVAGSTVTFDDLVEVVGGFYLDLAKVRSRYRELADPVKTPESRLAELRTEIEVEFDQITGRSFVPRFARHETVGRGSPFLGVPDPLVTKVRAVTVAGTVWSAPDVALLRPTRNGDIVRPGGAIWPNGVDVVVEYEHGLPVCPPPITTAAMLRVRSLINPGASGVPDRAETIVTPEGASFRLSMPGSDSTGIPDVDGALAKYPKLKRSVIA